jgi:hypothetical protein
MAKLLVHAALLTLPLAASIAGGCNRRDRTDDRTDLIGRVQTTRPLGQGPLPIGGGPPATTFDSRFDGVVAAQCDYEARCGNVGQGKRYGDRHACIADARAERMNEVATHDCGRGIDSMRLSDCLEAIKNSKCGDPVDSVSRFESCRSAMLCLPEKMVP